jgi:hypothetical protein
MIIASGAKSALNLGGYFSRFAVIAVKFSQDLFEDR